MDKNMRNIDEINENIKRIKIKIDNLSTVDKTDSYKESILNASKKLDQIIKEYLSYKM